MRPRLSRRQPMEAAATPLPREETTPPVTKMYFGAVRKALEFLRWNRRTPHYVRNSRACQIAFRILFSAFLQDFLHSLNISRHVDAHGVIIRLDNADAKAIFEPAELLQLLDAFEFPRRQCRKLQKGLAAESVKPNMLPMLGGDRRPVSRTHGIGAREK